MWPFAVVLLVSHIFHYELVFVNFIFTVFLQLYIEHVTEIFARSKMLTDEVPLARDTDGRCTTECDCGDSSDEVKQENLPVVRQEPEEVCYTGLVVTECDSGDWSGEVKQENLPVVKQEPEEVCHTGLLVMECDCEDSSGEVEQENLPVLMQEPEEVCYTRLSE